MAVKLVGLEETLGNLENFEININDAVAQAIKAVSIKVQQNAVLAINEISEGETVIRRTTQGNPYAHVASREGDAPNTDTGDLIKSISVKQDPENLQAFVFTPLKYGFFLETVHNRPWLEPAKVKAIPLMKTQIKFAINRQIKKAGKTGGVLVRNIKLGGES